MTCKRSIIILDFGSQYTQLIARCVRQMNVCSLILPYNVSVKKISNHSPFGLILSGGPSSVYAKKRPLISPSLLNMGVPILGICYGMQILILMGGGEVTASETREYGYQKIEIIKEKSLLYKGIKKKYLTTWMSHGDQAKGDLKGFEVTSKSGEIVASIEDSKKKIYGVQYHPEVTHTSFGFEILSNFVFEICKAKKNWFISSLIQKMTQEIKEQVGNNKVILGVSGGVDSMVMSVLLQAAVGDQLTCIFVNNGFLRIEEAEKVCKIFRESFKISFKYIDASKLFLKKIKGIKNPEKKRKIIGKLFFRVFFKEFDKKTFLAQGTLYPDVIESVSTKGPSETIKTHHNRVKQIIKLKKQKKVVEPFETFFKDEVREIGKKLKIPKSILLRQPFPGPGLAIRVIGKITNERLEILRKADQIFLEEIKKANLYSSLWQSFCVLLPIRSVGVMGDKRSYENTIVLRGVTSLDGMTADIVDFKKSFLTQVTSRIIGEVKGINRIVYDVTSKPPGTIEWE